MAVRAAFFDIGDTLGSVRFGLTGEPVSIGVFSYVRGVLEGLRAAGIRVGVISNTGTVPGTTLHRLLAHAGTASLFDPRLMIFSADLGVTKSNPAIFLAAAKAAELPPGSCLFVGEDARERSVAVQAGMITCPHPLLAADVANGATLSYLLVEGQVGGGWQRIVQGAGALPLSVSGPDARGVVVIASAPAVAMLVNAQLDVRRLGAPALPDTTDLYLLRDDVAAETGFLQPEGQSAELLDDPQTAGWLLSASAEGLLVAVPAGESIERIHLPRAFHGHTQKLRADPALLDLKDRISAAELFVAEGFQAMTLSATEVGAFSAGITADVISDLVSRYSGAAPLGDGKLPPTIASRHVHSDDDNRRAAFDAADRLAAMPGIEARLHGFDHEGRQLLNVEGTLKGSDDSWVLVTAHLDSTAAFDAPYQAATDPAPGADDDGSGVAGVLAAARVISALAAERPPKHGVRFVLFNAEEHGLIGSKAYAREQADAAATIVAVFQMDMIGFNREEPRSFEVHAGFAASPELEALALQLAAAVSDMVGVVSPALAPAQVYPPAAGARDPADGRSDHSSFLERGFPACVATEDFFVGPLPESPEQEGNPAYHRKTDTFIDPVYAADIARAVAAAAWITARGTG